MLPLPIEVKVTDGTGAAIADQAVSFEADPAIRFSANPATTGKSGVAAVMVWLPDSALKTFTITARAGTQSLAFTAYSGPRAINIYGNARNEGVVDPTGAFYTGNEVFNPDGTLKSLMGIGSGKMNLPNFTAQPSADYLQAGMDGKIYRWTRRDILVMDANLGFVAYVPFEMKTDRTFEAIFATSIGKDGAIWMRGREPMKNDSTYRVSLDGSVTNVSGSGGTPESMGVLRSGNVIYFDTQRPDPQGLRWYQYTPAGVSAGSGFLPVGEGLFYFKQDANGRIYVQKRVDSDFYIYDDNLQLISHSLIGSFSSLRGSDAAGNYYAAGISKFSPQFSLLMNTAQPPSAIPAPVFANVVPQPELIGYVAGDLSGNLLLLAGSAIHRLHGGALVNSFTCWAPGQVSSMNGVAANSAGEYYVTNWGLFPGSNNVTVCNAAGSYVRSIAHPALRATAGLVIDGSNNKYIFDGAPVNSQIFVHVFDSSDQFVRSIPISVPASFTGIGRKQIALASDGFIVAYENMVRRFRSNGTEVWSKTMSDVVGSIAIDSSGTVYIASTDANLQLLDLDGNPKISAPVRLPASNNLPNAVLLGAMGNNVVAIFDGRIFVLSSQ